jgi:protocatechuate 3,4-dioxygenase alpha subunit
VIGQTPFQTVGPFLHLGLRVGRDSPLPDTGRIRISGRLLDGESQGIPDGVLEFWHPTLPELQRAFSEGAGAFAIDTIKPAPIVEPNQWVQAPHFLIRVLGRGILTQYITRLYFAGDPANSADPILARVPEARRHTLMASPQTAGVYAFDIVLQGENETVFFDV